MGEIGFRKPKVPQLVISICRQQQVVWFQYIQIWTLESKIWRKNLYMRKLIIDTVYIIIHVQILHFKRPGKWIKKKDYLRQIFVNILLCFICYVDKCAQQIHLQNRESQGFQTCTSNIIQIYLWKLVGMKWFMMLNFNMK